MSTITEKTITEIVAKLNKRQKKALVDMPNKKRRFLALPLSDKVMIQGLCTAGPGWFVMGEIGYQVRASIMVNTNA